MASAQLTPIAKKYATMREAIEKRRGEFEAALPKTSGLDAARFIRVALTTFQVNPQILDCTPASIIVSMLQAAAFGLSLDTQLGQAYLVPYGQTCQLIPGYQGYMLMARRSGLVSGITARVVHANDHFEYVEGLEQHLTHRPVFGMTEPGEVLGAYCITRFKEGEPHIFAMSVRELNAIRDRSRARSGPWKTDLEAMYLKTVLRHARKFWPIYVEDLNRAAALDDAADTDRDQVIANLGDGIDLLPPMKEPEEKKSALDQMADAEEEAAAKAKPVTPPAEEKAPAPAQEPQQAATKKKADPKAAGAPQPPTAREQGQREQASRHELPRAHQQRVTAEQEQPGLLSPEESRALDQELANEQSEREEVRREPGSDDE